MNPLEYIQQYIKPIGEAAIVLKQLGQANHPLPSLEALENMKDKLLLIHPADVTVKLAWEDGVETKRRFIIDGLKGFVDIDAGIGAVMIDGVEYEYWDGMNKKLAALDKDKDEVKAYTNLVVAISYIVHDSTNGMRKDINYLFNDKIFEDRNVLADTTDVPHDEVAELKKRTPNGRPKGKARDIRSKLIGDDKERAATLTKLHCLIDGKRGRDVALTIIGCIKANKIYKPTYAQVRDEFGDIGDKSGYNKYIREGMPRDGIGIFTDAEINDIAKQF